MLLDDQFYRLTTIQYVIRELNSAGFEYQFNAYEEYDLYMKKALEEEEQVNLGSIEKAIRAFGKNVR